MDGTDAPLQVSDGVGVGVGVGVDDATTRTLSFDGALVPHAFFARMRT
jgi:hypothetical protein